MHARLCTFVLLLVFVLIPFTFGHVDPGCWHNTECDSAGANETMTCDSRIMCVKNFQVSDCLIVERCCMWHSPYGVSCVSSGLSFGSTRVGV